MNKRTTMTYAVAATTAAMLTLAGCNGGDEDPTATPTASNSSTSSTKATPANSPSSSTPTPGVSSTSATTTPLPSAAKAHTERGAVEYAKWYVAIVDQAFVTLDSKPVRANAKPDCVRCVALALGVEEAAKQKARQKSTSITIDNAFAAEAPETNPDQYFVDAQTTERAVDIVGPDGAVMNKTDAGNHTWRMNVDWSDGAWLVSSLEVL